jgi:phage tail sheath protein FI
MAFSPSESPAVTIREVDLSGIVPAVTSSTGAMVGDFNWGPGDQPILVGNEAELIGNFGSPTLVVDSNNIDFLSAASFLKYSGSLYASRAISSADVNAVDSSAVGLTGTLVKNQADWDEDKSGYILGTAGTVNEKRFIAKYPGEAGNSLAVSICPWSGVAGDGGKADSNDSAFSNWLYVSQFDEAPGTSSFVAARSVDGANAHDEAHVVVVDEGGKFTGTPGTVLETFPHVSYATDAKTDDGSNNHIVDVINDRSQYIWMARQGELNSTTTAAADWTKTTIAANVGGPLASPGGQNTQTRSFNGGAQTKQGHPVATYQTAFETVYKDPDVIQVDFLIAPGMAGTSDQKTLVEALEVIARVDRKDCVVVASPERSAIVGQQNANTITTAVKTFAQSVASSSYLILDGNYLKVYDKYNDKYTFIPAASSTAGIMAATDQVSAPWFSPAGNRRGQYFGVSALGFSPTKSQRDTLYKAGVNPIVNFPGQGVLLFGDKTKLARPSAFDRINVRRLFLVMERAIKSAAQNVMFEFNDEFTRAEFVNIVEPFLREIKGRRGITDFRVVCDETNNTANVIDTNQFVADIYVKPARSINYVTLSFVAVRTGVDFEEVVGLA